MKSAMKFSKASGTERAKVEKLIRRGWRPGCRVSDFLHRRKHQRRLAVGSKW